LIEWANGGIVLALLLLNATLGIFEEYRADKALQRLKSKLQIQARVLREGQWLTLASKELVPGDIVRVRDGDFVPAVRAA
jgi:H+-transporting ATPase